MAEKTPSKKVPKGHDVKATEVNDYGQVTITCACGWVGTQAGYAGDGREGGHLWAEGVVKADEPE
jgi:hypothetical protein